MYILAFYTRNGIPETGLAPVLDIWRVRDNTKLISAQAMAEVGGGFYKYDFTGYDPQEDYAVRCDGGSTLPTGDRYVYAGNEGYHDDIKDIQDSLTALEVLIKRILGLSQENYRLFDTVYDGSGKRLISCTIKIYGSKSDTLADTGPIATYNMVSTYDVDGQLGSYRVTKES